MDGQRDLYPIADLCIVRKTQRTAAPGAFALDRDFVATRVLRVSTQGVLAVESIGQLQCHMRTRLKFGQRCTLRVLQNKPVRVLCDQAFFRDLEFHPTGCGIHVSSLSTKVGKHH